MRSGVELFAFEQLTGGDPVIAVSGEQATMARDVELRAIRQEERDYFETPVADRRKCHLSLTSKTRAGPPLVGP